MIAEIEIGAYPAWMDYETPEDTPDYDIENSLLTVNCIRCKNDFITTDEGGLTHNICGNCISK